MVEGTGILGPWSRPLRHSLWENNGNLRRVDAATGAERGVLSASGPGTFASDVGTSGQRVFIAGGNLVTAVACDQ